MAQFLKCPDHVLVSNIVYSHVYAYILPELRPFLINLETNHLPKFVENNGEEMIQKMLDKSNNKLRMYGSAKEIAGNIKIFRNFTESFRFFDDQKYPFNASPVIYTSLNGEKYIYKPDIFTIIQNIALHTINHQKFIFFHSMLAKILKSKIVLANGPVEFVKFDEKMFDEIEKEMREVDAKSHQQAIAQRDYLAMSLSTNNYPAIASKFRELNPTLWEDAVANSYLKHLQLLSNRRIETQKEPIFIALTNTCKMNCIEEIMAKRAPLFTSTPESSPITVRLFEDGEERYVMEAELYHALNRLSPGSERFVIHNDGSQRKGLVPNATSFEEVRAEFGDRIQKIEFIRTPILRSKHRAVPIRAHFPGQFVIPAVDCFFEFWRNVILGVKLFQKYQCSDWEKYAQFFQEIEEYFDIEKKQQYFLQYDILESVVGNSLQQYEVSQIKDIRNAKKDGFTVQNLKNELNHLGLTGTFPDIQNYAEGVYEEIDKVKKERYLRTCDLFDAVESCQLICLLNRIPNYQKFLHNQKGCKRVFGYKCAHCEKEEEVKNTSDIQDSMKNLKIENTNSSTPNQYSQPALSAPKDCEKCSESSEILVKTQNELKISRDQLKEMQQKMTDTEKELSDSKKEHEKIVESEAKKTEELAEVMEELNNEKEKNQEKEEEILKASKENEELQKTILKLTAENEANERMIEKLLDRISNLSTNNQKTNEIDEKTIEESTQTTSVTSKNAPLIIDCLICSSQIKAGQEVIRCPLCKRRFHSNCAFKWRKDHTQCPACNGDLPGI
ncbi:hypothetical protein GCK72_003940 [Caenorhabditis remanei]|uniref:RING-type domain-containing protein n=1 Tax=Caenorhabditis remanei TaxID=31234 RepID=A0A6A5HAY3_CAERE|nr:hypothetical protein GCK72_003940 [Caenorhabditis remanei]KAF1763994.1 hypothetical protein GCK72_003940 [Caenorhabditis remanei]